MLLHKSQLMVADLCSTEASRPTLNGLHVTSTHAEATDGHVFLRFTPEAIGDAADFPAIEGVKQFDPGADGVVIPSAYCREAIKSAPKRARLPILESIMLGRNGSEAHVELVSMDLDRTNRTTARTLDGPFPNCECVIPKESESVAVRVRLGMGVLKRLVSTLDKMSKGQCEPGVTLEFRAADSCYMREQPEKGQKDEDRKRTPDYLSAIRFTMHADGGNVLGVLMPQRPAR